MKVSLSWLKEYVSIEMPTERLTDALTMAGLEVEAVWNRFDFLETVLVSRVLDVQPHPHADKLKICEVDIGDRHISVVCGAPNVTADAYAPTALPKTVFPDGSVLKESTIRGVSSEGMLCSEFELGLGPDQSGIMLLTEPVEIGQSLNQSLGLSDEVIEIDLTPNRPDCLSFMGVAREVAAIQGNEVRYPEIDLTDSGNIIAEHTSVTIEAPDACPRYAARLLTNVKIGPSPDWLQDRLLSIGLRPINNVVDITNFVLMETNQPLHAFDFDQLAEHRIVVRKATAGEKFVTLDGQERQLDPEMLMICDGEKPVALAGVMGGLNSEIEPATQRVLIESAYFDPVFTRKTAKKLGLNTEASHRFERGMDPEGVIRALNRSAALMVEICGSKLIDGVIDEYPRPIPFRTITLSAKMTNRLLGRTFDLDEIREYLASIGFSSEKRDPDTLDVAIPTYRVDVKRPVDLMEEVARLYGYENIPTTFPAIPAGGRKILPLTAYRMEIKDLLTGFGFTEMINYSFIHKDSCDRLGISPDDRRRSMVEILNPLTEDQSVMRTSLVPGLLEAIHRNLTRRIKNLKVFEIGKATIKSDAARLPEEIEMLAVVWTGVRKTPSWHDQETLCDFYDIKGTAEQLLASLGVEGTTYSQMTRASCDYMKPGHTAEIRISDRPIGLVGEVHPQILKTYQIDQPVFIFELNIDQLLPLIPADKQSEPLPRFPSVTRDFTLIVDRGVEAAKILRYVEGLNEELVESLFLFDVFEGKPIPEGKKSISFRITYRSSEKTLADEEVNRIHESISDRLLKTFDATLPV